jgi:hypothetical protein
VVLCTRIGFGSRVFTGVFIGATIIAMTVFGFGVAAVFVVSMILRTRVSSASNERECGQCDRDKGSR